MEGDLTGRFPHKLSRGNQYLLVIYDYDSNAILAEPLKTRLAGEMTKAWMRIHNKLATQGTDPSIYIIDNEASLELKTALNKRKVTFQLVSPHVHRQNAAEQAIITFKNHLLAILAGADTEYPVSEWDRFLPQCEMTLNFLRNSRVDPKLSSYAYLFGNFDFNKTPLAPLGTKIAVHLKSDKRTSFSYHGQEAWYIGPSMEHYRCFKYYFPATRSTRDADTVEFFPKDIPFPKTTSEDYLLQSDILAILKSPPKFLPYLQYGDSTKNALVQLSQLIKNAVEQPSHRSERATVVAPPPRVETPPTVLIPTPLAPLGASTGSSTCSSTTSKGDTPISKSTGPSSKGAMRQPFVPVSKPYYHLDRLQMFFNMPTPKQRLAPQSVGQPCLLRRPVLHPFHQGTNFTNMLSNTYKLNKCLPCLAAIMYTMTWERKRQSIHF